MTQSRCYILGVKVSFMGHRLCISVQKCLTGSNINTQAGCDRLGFPVSVLSQFLKCNEHWSCQIASFWKIRFKNINAAGLDKRVETGCRPVMSPVDLGGEEEFSSGTRPSCTQRLGDFPRPTGRSRRVDSVSSASDVMWKKKKTQQT